MVTPPLRCHVRLSRFHSKVIPLSFCLVSCLCGPPWCWGWSSIRLWRGRSWCNRPVALPGRRSRVAEIRHTHLDAAASKQVNSESSKEGLRLAIGTPYSRIKMDTHAEDEVSRPRSLRLQFCHKLLQTTTPSGLSAGKLKFGRAGHREKGSLTTHTHFPFPLYFSHALHRDPLLTLLFARCDPTQGPSSEAASQFGWSCGSKCGADSIKKRQTRPLESHQKPSVRPGKQQSVRNDKQYGAKYSTPPEPLLHRYHTTDGGRV